MGTPPSVTNGEVLLAHWLDTRLGPMLAIASANHLLLLEFVDRRGLEREIERVRQRLKMPIIPGSNSVIEQLRQELADYFAGISFTFNTPIAPLGTPFQRSVWAHLIEIPLGTTISYLQLAHIIDKPSAARAVANANGANQLALIIPCHRVINSNGELGGYGGGIQRKQWLLQHERAHKTGVL